MTEISVEKFTADLFAEILPLAQKCWNECSVIKGETCAYHGQRDFAIDPNVEKFDEMAKNGALIVVTLRDGELKGYIVGVLYHSLHLKKVLCAGVDNIYIEPEFRTYSPVMVKRFEDEAKQAGVEIIGWPVSAGTPIHELLKAVGYVADDVVMEKRLCV